ncbi:MAG: FAD-binding oxidoreductase [Acidobacteriota bacterium]
MGSKIDRREFLKQSSLSMGAAAASSRLAAGSVPEVDLKTVAEIDRASIRKFTSLLQGQALLPGDDGYESACRNWTGRVTKRPGLVVRCAGTEDVAGAVKFARDHGLLLAVRGGGHTGNSTCDGGLLINLSALKDLHVDPARRVVRAQAGLLAGELDRATCASGLATVMGECPSVGISGMGLGGGLGRLMGQYGALCDNLLWAEVVTADGSVLQASARENSDLFWAIRGGGGNFGVVTSFDYRLHPVDQVLSGMLHYPVTQAGAVLRFFREWMLEAPDELDALVEIGSGILQYAPESQEPTVVINVCCSGDPDFAGEALRPLRAFGTPTADTIRPMPYLEAQDLGDVTPLRRHLTSSYLAFSERGFLTGLADDAIEAIAAHCENPPSTSWAVALDHFLHGAVCRVGESETAFSLRQNGCSVRITSFEEGTAGAERSMAWAQSLHEALQPFSDGRIYVNYLLDQSKSGVRAAFGGNYSRLLELKAKYDSDNFFRLNANIR